VDFASRALDGASNTRWRRIAGGATEALHGTRRDGRCRRFRAFRSALRGLELPGVRATCRICHAFSLSRELASVPVVMT
jgi:hypothetical protein